MQITELRMVPSLLSNPDKIQFQIHANSKITSPLNTYQITYAVHLTPKRACESESGTSRAAGFGSKKPLISKRMIIGFFFRLSRSIFSSQFQAASRHPTEFRESPAYVSDM